MIAKHAIVTDECRLNRTDLGAVLEALERLKLEAMECIPHWPIGKGHKLHFKFEIEPAPESHKESQE